MREAFPTVGTVRIDLTFEDFDQREKIPARPGALRFTPEDKAFFELKCPFRECVEGGFDFESAVREAIRTGQAAATDSKTCEGWQDQERIGKYRCLLKVRYEIHVE